MLDGQGTRLRHTRYKLDETFVCQGRQSSCTLVVHSTVSEVHIVLTYTSSVGHQFNSNDKWPKMLCKMNSYSLYTMTMSHVTFFKTLCHHFVNR